MNPLRASLLVFFGGTVGVLIRWAVVHLVPVESLWAVFAINIVGSFCLGLFYGLGDRWGSRSWLSTTAARLAIGTGIMGGFTTYSTFAVDIVHLGQSNVVMALSFASGELFLGVAAAMFGLWVAQRGEQIC